MRTGIAVHPAETAALQRYGRFALLARLIDDRLQER
jgi:hypothetical protein